MHYKQGLNVFLHLRQHVSEDCKHMDRLLQRKPTGTCLRGLRRRTWPMRQSARAHQRGVGRKSNGAPEAHFLRGDMMGAAG